MHYKLVFTLMKGANNDNGNCKTIPLTDLFFYLLPLLIAEGKTSTRIGQAGGEVRSDQ